MSNDSLRIGELELHSRVLLGSAIYPSTQVMLDCLAASGTEMVTVALRRVNPATESESLYELLRGAGVHVLPNTAGCYTAQDAVLTAQLAREGIGTELVIAVLIGGIIGYLLDTWLKRSINLENSC